ncbi:hypothetical protein GCM10023075_38100 [Streptosporangium album]
MAFTSGAAPVRSGLRARLTSFVGRKDETSRLGALLGESRLITLVGPGGAGKTRLAGEVAAAQRGDVCFVELAPVADGGMETIRAYCAERLAEAGETETYHEAHAAHYVDLATTADPHLRSDGQLEWLRRLDDERDDLHAALRWTVDTGRIEQGLRLLAGLAMYWWARGRRSEGEGLAADLLGVIGPSPVEGLEEEYAICVLLAFSSESRSPETSARLEAVAPFIPSIDQPYRYPFLGMLWPLFTGPADSGAIGVPDGPVQAAADPWLWTLARFGYGYYLLHSGDAGTAERSFEDVLKLFRSLGDRWGTALTLAELADVREDRAASRALADEALRLAEELESVEDIAELVYRRAQGSVRDGDLETAHAGYLSAASSGDRAEARGWYVKALEPALRRYLPVAGSVVEALAEITLLEGDAGGAARLLGAATTLRGTASAHPDAVRVTAAVRARIGGTV